MRPELARAWHDEGMLRWLTAGESHGPALVAVLEGMPAGVQITSEVINAELARRRLGYGRGSRMNFEADQLEIIGGIRHGVSIGSPIALRIANSEWPKWEQVMAADPVEPQVLEGLGRAAALTRPRPGHADLAGMQKYGFEDARPVLERASARETAARVALGACAQALLAQGFGVQLVAHVVSIGTVSMLEAAAWPTPGQAQELDADPVRCGDPATSQAMIAEIDAAKTAGDTLGGVVQVLAYGLPPGLGSYVHADRRLDARLAGALMSIQAIKGVEVGEGMALARLRGSQAHDEIEVDPRVADNGAVRVRRRTGRSGGIEGGMSTGDTLRVRAGMKPIATVARALDTVDVATATPAQAIAQRSDVCAVPAAAVVAQAMVALVLAQACVEKFGGDSLGQMRQAHRDYLDSLAVRS